MSRTFKMLISNWPRTRKFNRLLHLHAGKAIAFDFSHCHALITLYVQFLYSDWSKFDRWVHVENLCSVWKLAYWLLKLTEFCVILWCFKLSFSTWQNEIQQLSRLFCNSWLVSLFRFLLTNASLVKVIGNPISDGIVFKNELTHLPLLDAYKEGWKVSSHSGLTFRSSISTVKPEQLLSLMCFYFSVSWGRA